MSAAMGAPAIWTELRMWSVQRYPTGGWLVVCNGEPHEWFRYEARALNEARKLNCAEMLRLQRLRDSMDVAQPCPVDVGHKPGCLFFDKDQRCSCGNAVPFVGEMPEDWP